MSQQDDSQRDFTDIRDVIVDGRQAVWIFTEFETDKSVDDLESWLAPEQWPVWGSAMFKRMDPLAKPRTSTAGGLARSHTKYLEVVELAGNQLSTVLGCDAGRTDRWAAVTYELDHSVGDVIEVDRGFLLALDLGDRRQVKALKVVGFTDPVTDDLATTIRGAWSEWVRQAADEAGEPVAPAVPTHGAVGDGAPRGERPATEAGKAFTEGYGAVWADNVADMANFYGAYATDVGTRLWSGDYTQKDAAEDSSRLFLRLARDWSRVWRAGVEMVDSFADVDVPPTSGAGVGVPARTVEFTTMLVPQPNEPAPVAMSDLARLGPDGPDAHVIKASSLRVSPATIGGGSGSVAVTVTADTTSAPAGLYFGEVLVGSPPGQGREPALFYVSRARPGP